MQSCLGAQETQADTSAVTVLAVATLTVEPVSSYEVARAYTGEEEQGREEFCQHMIGIETTSTPYTVVFQQAKHFIEQS